MEAGVQSDAVRAAPRALASWRGRKGFKALYAVLGCGDGQWFSHIGILGKKKVCRSLPFGLDSAHQM